MDMNCTSEEIAFRDEVRAFLADRLPAELAAKVKGGKRLKKKDYELWHARLNARGWLAWHWPKEYGGAGWTLDYLRTRKQFGVPLGKFQALQHRMVEMCLEIEKAHSATILAAGRMDAPRADRETALSADKNLIGRVGRAWSPRRASSPMAAWA